MIQQQYSMLSFVSTQSNNYYCSSDTEEEEEEGDNDDVAILTTRIFSESEEIDIVDTMIQYMTDFVDNNPTEISEPDFHDSMIQCARELIMSNVIVFVEEYITSGGGGGDTISKVLVDETINDLLSISSMLFYIQIIPPRSQSSTFVVAIPDSEQIVKLKSQIDYLKSKPQPEQRTDAWYIFRHNLITASNAYKAFENQNVQNQLIYEKCQPLRSSIVHADDESIPQQSVNVNSPLHWGQKYEPLSVMYYEREYNTQVGDFGCIQHETHLFLGASPDGINNDPTRPERYGRMLEIKNIVNREITGIPKKEYWIQMQLQMETCNLDECDFLETRFSEYENYEAFIDDGYEIGQRGGGQRDFNETINGDVKGIIMYFSTNEGKPKYVYKPLNMTESEFVWWSEVQMLENVSPTTTWIRNIYWKLAEVSCVLVQRNKKWFADNISQMSRMWDIIIKERESETGYEHRAPKRRAKKVAGEVIAEKPITDFFEIRASTTATTRKIQMARSGYVCMYVCMYVIRFLFFTVYTIEDLSSHKK